MGKNRSTKIYLNVCAFCNKEYQAQRSDSKTCSSECRVKLSIIKRGLPQKTEGGSVLDKIVPEETYNCFFYRCGEKAVVFVQAHIPTLENKKVYYSFCSMSCLNKFVIKYRPVAKVITDKSDTISCKFLVCASMGAGRLTSYYKGEKLYIKEVVYANGLRKCVEPYTRKD